MPCGDTKDHDNLMEEQQHTEADHSQHDHETESCTPFCICSCCGSQIVTISFNRIEIKGTEPLSPTFQLYQASFTSEIYLSIWQPPKLS